MSTVTIADGMHIATVENLPAQSNRAVFNSWRIARGVIWGGLAVVVLPGWFVVARLGLRQDLRVWDVMALRFGEGALFLTPVLLVGRLRLRVQAWPSGIILALLWGAPCILLVGLGLQATSATMTPALMPVFAGFVAWTFFGERPSRRQLSGYGMIAAGLFALVCIYVQATGRPDIGGAAALVTAAVLWAVHTLRLPRAGVTSLQAAALICFWSAILYLPLYLGLSLSSLTQSSEGELVFQSIYQGIMMSVVALFAFNRAVVLLGSRAAAVIITLMPITATLLAIPVLGERPSWPSAAAICIIALGVGLAATSSNQDNKKGESQ